MSTITKQTTITVPVDFAGSVGHIEVLSSASATVRLTIRDSQGQGHEPVDGDGNPVVYDFLQDENDPDAWTSVPLATRVQLLQEMGLAGALGCGFTVTP